MAKKFLFICFGILALAGAYAVGAGNSVAQVGGSEVVAVYVDGQVHSMYTANGDIYSRTGYINNSGNVPVWSLPDAQWTYMGNCFSGGAVNSQGTTIGDVKSLFR